jgi:signal transduction histidine kinase
LERILSDPASQLIEPERIQSVFQQAPLSLVVTVINSVLTAFVLASVVRLNLLVIWVALIIGVSVARWAVRQCLFYREAAGAGRLWAALSILGSMTTGILWGVGAIVLPPAAEIYQLFFAFVVGGMCAGATAINSAHLPTVLAFIWPATLPLAASLLVEGTPVRIVSALMILVFASALSLTSWRAHRAFGEHLRLQFELSRQARMLQDANEQLVSEVAERQKAEAILHQAQKMEAIGHLTGGIAHDFNNLLHVVTGNLSMIGRLAKENARILNHVQAAEQAAKQGARLTSSLLAFARRQSLQVERVSVNILLQEFQPLLLRALGTGVRFETFLAASLPCCNVDPAHFQSAILNLVINARDAMPRGGQISITTDVTTLRDTDLLANPDARAGRFVSISVQDNGVGMTAEVLAQVFEPFFTTKEIGKGSGLGLSQVYGFAHQSGGCVQLRSEPEVGTCVTLYLPAVDEQD